MIVRNHQAFSNYCKELFSYKDIDKYKYTFHIFYLMFVFINQFFLIFNTNFSAIIIINIFFRMIKIEFKYSLTYIESKFDRCH